MFGLDQSSIRTWNAYGDLPFPGTFSLHCPGCADLITFRAGDPFYEKYTKTIAALSECPACRQIITVWAIHPKPGTYQDKSIIDKCDAIGVFPPPRMKGRMPIEGVELLPERIHKQYMNALAVYNAGVWDAAANRCRVTLEGVVKGLVPSAKGNLANQIKALSTWPDLGKPLVILSDTLREGGNIGSHFDEEKETDQETAEAMIELLEYLLEYVYALPAMVNKLEQKIAALGNTAADTATN